MFSREWLPVVKEIRSQLLQAGEKDQGEHGYLAIIDELDCLLRFEYEKKEDRERMANLQMGHIAVYPLAGRISDDLSKAVSEISQSVRRWIRQHRMMERQPNSPPNSPAGC